MEVITVVLQAWDESERGWGVRPNGYTLHFTTQDHEKFVKNFWNEQHKNDGGVVPDEYTRESGRPQPVSIVKNGYFHRLLIEKEKDYGCWGSSSSPRIKDGVLEEVFPLPKILLAEPSPREAIVTLATKNKKVPRIEIMFDWCDEERAKDGDMVAGLRAILHNVSAEYDLSTISKGRSNQLAVTTEDGVEPSLRFADYVKILNYLDSIDCQVYTSQFIGIK